MITWEKSVTLATRCEAESSNNDTNCRDINREGETALPGGDTRRVSGSGGDVQVDADTGVAAEVLPLGSHVALMDAPASVPNRVTSTSTPEVDAEELDIRTEALRAFWALILEVGYEPC